MATRRLAALPKTGSIRGSASVRKGVTTAAGEASTGVATNMSNRTGQPIPSAQYVGRYRVGPEFASGWRAPVVYPPWFDVGEPTQTGVQFAYLTPRALPKPETLPGRVAVLDIAFAAEGGGSSFEEVTLPFINGLGSRLAAWVDHHDHERHEDYAGDPRFVLSTKAEHGACPEMVTPEVVAAAGPVDTVAVHVDLDGLCTRAPSGCSAASSPTRAPTPTRARSTRAGASRAPSPPASIGRCARASATPTSSTGSSSTWWRAPRRPTTGRRSRPPPAWSIRCWTRPSGMAERYRVDGQVAYVRPTSRTPYDKTELLLLGQRKAAVAVVHDSGSLSIAADFESGLDFVKLFELGGGMPTRVSIPESRLEEVLAKLQALTGPANRGPDRAIRPLRPGAGAGFCARVFGWPSSDGPRPRRPYLRLADRLLKVPDARLGGGLRGPLPAPPTSRPWPRS